MGYSSPLAQARNASLHIFVWRLLEIILEIYFQCNGMVDGGHRMFPPFHIGVTAVHGRVNRFYIRVGSAPSVALRIHIGQESVDAQSLGSPSTVMVATWHTQGFAAGIAKTINNVKNTLNTRFILIPPDFL